MWKTLNLRQGKTYMNANGDQYRCTGKTTWGHPVMERIPDKWTLVAHGVKANETGEIEWDYSTDGHWPQGYPKF